MHQSTHRSTFKSSAVRTGIVCTMLAAANAALADTVTLRPSVRVAHGGAVTLSEIATLDGSAANAHASLEIAQADAGAFEIAAETVRQKLASAGADLGTLKIVGTTTAVRPARGRAGDAAQERPVANAQLAGRAHDGAAQVRPGSRGSSRTSLRNEAPAEELIDPAQVSGQSTPLGLLAGLLENAFGAEFATMRVSIRSADIARLAPKPGMRHEVVAKNAVRSDRVDLEIIAHSSDGRVVSRDRVSVEPRVSREVLVARCDARRGTGVDAATERETRLVPPSVADRAADPRDAAGSSLARTVSEGTVLEADDVARELAVRRNERVLVRREVGLVAVEIEAIALEDGAAGDIIALEHARPGRRGRESQPLSAEIVGRGRAIVRSQPMALKD